MAVIRLKKNKLSELLVSIHTHAEIANEEDADQIVYREKDIIELLQKLKENNEILNEGLEFENNKNSNQPTTEISTLPLVVEFELNLFKFSFYVHTIYDKDYERSDQ